MVDHLILTNKIVFIHQTLKKLQVLQKLPKEGFLADFQAIDSTKYNLHDEQIYQILQTDIKDIGEFADRIEKKLL